MSSALCSVSRKPFTVLVLILLAGGAAARGAGELRQLRPGQDSNLNWVEFIEVATETAKSRKPVLVYFFEGTKTQENSGPMIDAQLRLFPDDGVKTAAAGFVCTKVDWTDPQAVERALASRNIKAGILERRKDRKKGGGGKDDGEGADPGGDVPPGDGEESEPAAEAAPPPDPVLILETKDWAQGVALYLLDYRGRPIEKITKLSSNSRNFAQTLAKAKLANEGRIKTDEKAAAKAAKEEEKRAAEEAARKASEKSTDGEADPADPDRAK